jgi:Tfp pilus assembly protein PilV
MKYERGFSTLEVIAAVAIIGIALIPIIALQTQLTQSQVRLEQTQADSTAVQNAMALLREVNPMATPTGERHFSDSTTLTWTSAPASPLRPSANAPGFEVQLYRVTAAIHRPGAPLTTVRVDLIGWRATAEAGMAQ